MGVKDFFKICVNGKTFEELGRRVTLKDFKDKTLGIDASFIIYNSATAFTLSDENSAITSHLHVILNKILAFKKLNITQLWIFDNPEQHAKKRKREPATEFRLNADIVAETQALLTNMGITYVTAPKQVEAEHLGAMLSVTNSNGGRVCDYIISGDSDVLMFGGNLLRVKREKSKTVYFAYDFDDFLADSGLTYDELVKVGVAMGNDFNVKIRGVGPKTVVKKVRDEFDTLIKEDTEEQKLEKLGAIAEFKSRPKSPLDKVNGLYNKDAVIAMLEKRGFNSERLQKIII